MSLTPEQQSRYERDGYLVFDRLFAPAEVEGLLERLGEIIAAGDRRPPGIRLQVEPALQAAGMGEWESGRAGDPVRSSHSPILPFSHSLRKVEGLVENDDRFGALARDPRLIGIFSGLLGPDLKLFRDALMMKPPRHGSAKPYHQDSAYWAIDPPVLASVWLALDEATLENGCMRVLPESHRWGLLEHQHLDDFQVDETRLDTCGEVAVPLPPGGCLIFHSMLLHATSPNHSPTPRRSMIVSVMSAHSRWTGPPEKQPSFPLLAGQEYPGCV
jgi:hypothetical protein